MQMQNHEQSSVRVRVRRGDIVWVRVQFPHQWWPALVLGSDNLGVFVSFFDHNHNNNNNIIISPSYFVESEVVPFEETFRSLMGHHNNYHNKKHRCDREEDTFYVLLDSALRLLGQRVLSSLRCRCQMPPRVRIRRVENRNSERKMFDLDGSGYCFQPIGLLGFVLNAAVLPWVDALDFVDAVRAVAQVHAFRGYCSVQQKRIYKKTQKTGNNVKLHPCSSLGEKMHSVTQECVALEPKDEYQIIPKQVEKNLASGAMGLKSTVPVSEGNSEHLFKNQLLIIPETLTNKREAELLNEISFDLHSPALDPFYMVGQSLKSEKQSLLRFKNISDQGIVDICFRNRNCSKMSKTHFSVPCNFKTHLRNYANRRKDNALELCGRLPDIETTIYLTRKRRRLDQPALCDCSLTRQRILSFSSINEAFASLQIIKSGKKKHNSDVSISSSALANCFSSCNEMEMDLYKVSLLHSPIKLKIENLSSNQGLSVTCTCGNSCMNLCYSAACCMPLLKDASCHVFPQISRVQESEGNADTSKCTRPSMSHIKMLEPEESIQKDNQAQAFISFCETTMNFTDEVQKVDLKKSQHLTLQQSFACESSSNLELGIHSNNTEVDSSAAKIEGILRSDPSVYQKRLQISSDDDTTPLKSKKSARVKLSSGDCLVEDRNVYQGAASCSIFNAKVGKRSKTHVPFASSTSLYMKFPKNFNLPSKGELIKKFSVFGSVDSSKTRVFCYTGSAQVTFFQEADAVAAHLYAIKKKVGFGEANVRFWLDPFELKRRGSKCFALMSPTASKPVGPSLKSCLKKSNSLRKENRKKHYRVRFTIET